MQNFYKSAIAFKQSVTLSKQIKAYLATKRFVDVNKILYDLATDDCDGFISLCHMTY